MINANPQWSSNTTAYFDLWRKTLHQNCKGKPECVCHEGAYQLTLGRLASIARGMPDLHPDVEQEIWGRAFEIHRDRCANVPRYSSSSIAPTWSDPKDAGIGANICNCFEIAMYDQPIAVAKIIPPVELPDPFLEEREV